MSEEAYGIIAEIEKLLENAGCEVIRRDIRVKNSGANWTADIRVTFKPVHSDDMGG